MRSICLSRITIPVHETIPIQQHYVDATSFTRASIPTPNSGIGGQPTLYIDVPICAVFILLYAGAAAGHQTIYQMNRRKGHKFIPSLALFGFCMSRILTCALRMAWATHQRNVPLAIAANILVSAGILIVYIVNLLLTQRIIRAVRPQLGWHPIATLIPKILYILVGVALALVISFTVLSFYTLNQSLLTAARDVQLAAITYLLVFTLVPVVVLPIAFFTGEGAHHFGEGGMGAKIVVVMVSSLLCLLEQAFRAATTWEPPRPANSPAWYHSRAAFYTFDFALEIVVIYWLLLTRVDERFHVADGSSKRGHYHQPAEVPGEKQQERSASEA